MRTLFISFCINSFFICLHCVVVVCLLNPFSVPYIDYRMGVDAMWYKKNVKETIDVMI